MSILDRVFNRSKVESRAGSYYGGGGFAVGAGGAVMPWQAENLSTVVACVNAIATGLATLPAAVYQQQGNARIEVPNHPAARLLCSPNSRQTWPDWVEWTAAQALLWGNSVSVIEYDGAGRPTALIPCPFQNVLISLLPSGRLAYDVVAYQAPWGGSGQPRRFLDAEIFHLRDRGDDGFIGRSRISRAPDVLNAAIGLQSYSSAVWENAATPKGMVVLPKGVGREDIRRVESWFGTNYAGATNAGRTLFMEPGTEWTSLNVSPEDAEVLASRQFSVIELCRLFNVPPPIVQDYSHSTFTNASQASTWFATNTLTPWARKIEAEFARSVFADPAGAFHIEIDLSGLVRGDYATRWTANVAAVTAGILTADEVRAQEGYGPLPAVADAADAADAANEVGPPV